MTATGHRIHLPAKKCVSCGRRFTRRETEDTWGYRRRQTCSRACKGRLASRNSRRANPRVIDPPRECVVCGGPFTRRDNELLAHFRKRGTCSMECKGRLLSMKKRGRSTGPSPRRLDLGAKACASCGEPFTRRDNEIAAAFRSRKTCSRDCWRKLAGANARRASQAAAAQRAATPKPRRAAKPPKAATPQPKAPPVRVVDTGPRWEPPANARSRFGETPVMTPDGPVERCPQHGDVLGVYGCPACNAGEKWRGRQVAHVGIGSRP